MEDRLNHLFKKYLENRCSDQEILELLDHFKVIGQETLLRGLIGSALENETEPNIRLGGVEQRLDEAYANVRQAIAVQEPVQRKLRLWPRIAAAAVVLLVAGAGLFFYLNDSRRHTTEQVNRVGDVSPGRVGATLTLASGKKIRLADAVNGEIAREAGISIIKTADGQIVYEIKAGRAEQGKFNTLSTANGEIYTLTLPDKSKVWMNAASSITYASGMNDADFRRVSLKGEAYFEVAKDKLHPFVVESGGQQVQVLGTHFNINAYGDEPAVTTTLLEGSVRIFSLADLKQSRVLKPDQQSRFSGDQIKVNAVSAQDAVDWKNGEFVFEGEPLESIMRKVSRWYDVSVSYTDAKIKTQAFSGSVSRFENLSQLLAVLESTSLVKCKISGKNIVISPI